MKYLLSICYNIKNVTGGGLIFLEFGILIGTILYMAAYLDEDDEVIEYIKNYLKLIIKSFIIVGLLYIFIPNVKEVYQPITYGKQEINNNK